MRVTSVNVGRSELIQRSGPGKGSYRTGIFKQPVDAPVRITFEGIASDYVGNKTYHGGPDQAVYLYGLTDYQWWASVLGRELGPGTFGENLTLDDLDNAVLAVGDRFRIGDVLLEITSPRVPCSTLSRRMGDSSFLKKFRAAARPGPYCRVIQEGEIQSGDAVHYQPCTGERLTLLEVFQAEFSPPRDAATLRRHLAAPLSIRMRKSKEKLLSALKDEGSGFELR